MVVEMLMVVVRGCGRDGGDNAGSADSGNGGDEGVTKGDDDSY